MLLLMNDSILWCIADDTDLLDFLWNVRVFVTVEIGDSERKI